MNQEKAREICSDDITPPHPSIFENIQSDNGEDDFGFCSIQINPVFPSKFHVLGGWEAHKPAPWP